MSEIQNNASKSKYEQDNLVYLINEEEKAASIFSGKSAKGEIIIPRSISIGTNEYIIISILKGAFKTYGIKSVRFSINSELSIIDDKAFYKSSIESFTVPPKLTKIGQYCFYSCKKLQKVIIPSNSKLFEIGDNSFFGTKIEYFTIPPHLTYIGESAFHDCVGLRTFEIPTESELQTLGKNALYKTQIECISIPKNLIELNEGWCSLTTKLTRIDVNKDNPRYSIYDDNRMIIGKSSIMADNYDTLVFCVRNVKNALIPDFVKVIGAHAFSGSASIVKIDIPFNSNLTTIGSYAFFHSSIECFSAPKSLEQINEFAFHWCRNLKKVEFPKDSNLRSIDFNAFSYSAIEAIWLPESLRNIDGRAFYWCKNLKKVEFSANSKLHSISTEAFNNTSIVSFTIPPYVSSIGSSAFGQCLKLQIVEIDENSTLESIIKNVFKNSKSAIVMIPVELKKHINLSFK